MQPPQGVQRLLQRLRVGELPPVIRSRLRLTYEEAEPLLNGTRTGDAGLDASLANLAAVHGHLLSERARRGALAFPPNDVRILIDEDGAMVGIGQPEALNAHSMIEEAMVAANRCAAAFLRAQGVSVPRRAHRPPVRSEMASLRDRLAVIAGRKHLTADLPRSTDPSEIAAAIGRIVKEAREAGVPQWLCDDAVKRALPKAGYHMGATVGHFGLAVPDYAHFTSPIRRYADVLIHRAVKALLRGEPPPAVPQGTCLHINERGALIAKAVRKAEDAVLVKWFRQRAPWRKQAMQGTVSGVAEFGAFVTFHGGWQVDGLVHVSDLGRPYDWIEAHPFRPYELFVEGSGERVIGVGDPVLARVSHIRPDDSGIAIGSVRPDPAPP